MSSGCPSLLRGILAISGSITDFGTSFIISVSVIPGATAFTLIPFGPNSLARDIVRPFTANFDAGYAKPDG